MLLCRDKTDSSFRTHSQYSPSPAYTNSLQPPSSLLLSFFCRNLLAGYLWLSAWLDFRILYEIKLWVWFLECFQNDTTKMERHTLNVGSIIPEAAVLDQMQRKKPIQKPHPSLSFKALVSIWHHDMNAIRLHALITLSFLKQNKTRDKRNPFLKPHPIPPQVLCHANREFTNIVVNLNNHSWVFVV